MADQVDKRSWWPRFRRPKPNMKIDELEAKLRKAEREREEKERKRSEGSG